MGAQQSIIQQRQQPEQALDQRIATCLINGRLKLSHQSNIWKLCYRLQANYDKWQISEIHLDHNMIAGEAIAQIAKINYEKSNTPLKALILSHNDIVCDNLKYFRSSYFKTLLMLYLDHNKIGSDGCYYLSKTSFPKLQTLDLTNNLINQNGAAHLATSIFPRLVSLLIQSTDSEVIVAIFTSRMAIACLYPGQIQQFRTYKRNGNHKIQNINQTIPTLIAVIYLLSFPSKIQFCLLFISTYISRIIFYFYLRSYRNMNNDSIYAWIISHSQNYPGKHQTTQPRTSESVKPLDPKAQFHLVIRALGQYIKENVQAGRGINYRNFGAFAFEVDTELVKPAQNSNFDITKQLSNQREERMHNHKIRPCFVPDKKLQQLLLRYPGKQQITKPNSQHSIYQKGFNMIYCNPTPIASSCSLDKDVTQSILVSFARAVGDLAELGKTLEIVIGPCTIKIVNRNMTYSYGGNFAKELNEMNYQKNLKKSLKETKEHWEESYNQKWQKSNLSQMITKPSVEATNQLYEKALTLKIMSLDLNTTQKKR